MRTGLFGMVFIITLIFSGKEILGQAIIPQPNEIKEKEGHFTLKEGQIIAYSDFDNGQLSYYLQGELMDRFGIYTKVSHENEKADYQFVIEPNWEKEEYQLEVANNIFISGREAGIFYGIQSLLQIVYSADKEKDRFRIPNQLINDIPRFSWRGIMLDESRHFFGKDVVKQLLKWMAFYKLNVFHWHLTDSPGWRVEIKQYPDLANIGGIGDDHDPDQPAQYYTQDEIREIVNYASKLHILVIPEIDMPGHATSINRAYPVFSGGGSENHPEFTLHPTRDTVVQFLTDVLKEIDAMFPSQMIHIGGDEVHFGNQEWKTDPDVVKWMNENNASSLIDVEHYFLRRMADTVRALNNTLLGWDEVINADLDTENSIIYWWRHDKHTALTSALDKNYDIVLCPRIPLYLDFVQDENNFNGRKWGGRFADLQTLYQFPPDTLYHSSHNNQVLGMQGNIWTERIADNNRLMFMTFPRITALSEAGWSNNAVKNYDRYLERLQFHLPLFKDAGIYYYDVFNPASTPEPPIIEGK